MELQKFLLMCSDCFWYVDFPLKTFQPHKNMLNPLRTLRNGIAKTLDHTKVARVLLCSCSSVL